MDPDSASQPRDTDPLRPTIIPGSTSGPTDTDAWDETFGDYELLEEIARGGMGVVYRARHKKLNRVVALKMILGGRFSSAEDVQRFHIEAEAAAKLDHPGIVPVYDIGEEQGQAFYAMKYVEGGSLADRIDELRTDQRKAIRVLSEVAAAVQHAHQRGILHRDLKPENVLMDVHDRPLVTDLGLAKSTGGDSKLAKTGAVMGTPHYMPPEQAAADQPVTTAADIYALGAILYELLTGRPPHTGETALDVLMSVMNNTPADPRTLNGQADPELELICLKCIAREPADRYLTAAELAVDLNGWLNGDLISVRPPAITAVAARWIHQNRRLVYVLFSAFAGIALLAPVALIVFGGSSLGNVYSDYFPHATPPWYTTVRYVPEWVGKSLVLILVLIAWPSFGLWNAVVLRPKSRRSALGASVMTGAVCAGLFVVAFGWFVAVVFTANLSSDSIEQLGRAVWTPYQSTAEAEREAVDGMFDGLENVPQAQRWYVVRDRVFADNVAKGPIIMALIAAISVVTALPIVYGTVIAASLLKRGLPIWLVVLCYAIAWVAVSAMIVICGFVLAFDLRNDQETAVVIASVVAIFSAIAALRQWSRPLHQASLAAPEAERPPTPLPGS